MSWSRKPAAWPWDDEQYDGLAADVCETVVGATGQVGETLGEVGHNVGGAVGSGLHDAGWRMDRFKDSSPLAMGAITLGVGGVAGAVVPETPEEREVLGDASRAVAETVRNTVAEATDEAEATLERARQPSA